MGKVLIGIDKSKSFRVYLTISTKFVEEARALHNTSPLATAALGRVLTGAGIMSLMLKNNQDRLTVLFKGDGPAKQILAVGKGSGEIKGYISNPEVDLPLNKYGKLDVGGALGIGELTVIKDLGLKEPYSGNIALVSGEIADDLTAYFFISEQQNTSIALGVKVGKEKKVLAAGGLFIQMLPNGEEEVIDQLEKILDSLKPITTLIEEIELASANLNEEEKLEKLLNKIFEDIEEKYKVDVLEYKDINFSCDCSKEKMTKALMAIGKKDLQEIIEEDEKAELECHFCGSKYEFSKEELEEIIKNV